MQFRYLNEWEQDSLCFVSKHGVFVLKFTLQHQAKWWWCLILYGLLHFMYFKPWAQQAKVVCPHFQQFLYWETSELILVLWMMAILSRLLTMDLTFIFVSYFIFSFSFLFFSFSIFRTTRVRGYQSCCHISHNLMA